MEVVVIRTTSNKAIIHCLDAQFAGHALPRGLRTDNGSNFVSKELEEYLKETFVTKSKWRSGKTEQVSSESARAAHAESKKCTEELNRFLLAYRTTPHSTTGKSSAELLFIRRLPTKMPELVDVEDEEVEVSDQAVRGPRAV